MPSTILNIKHQQVQDLFSINLYRVSIKFDRNNLVSRKLLKILGNDKRQVSLFLKGLILTQHIQVAGRLNWGRGAKAWFKILNKENLSKRRLFHKPQIFTCCGSKVTGSNFSNWPSVGWFCITINFKTLLQ